ncbi:MAG: YhjD/YihY/BrkB family envelope integrity protein [Arhodomonas sp.]|nr:YhjD/YihY/BrkB family envelope integrity protein [Arhodomonas sp.]
MIRGQIERLEALIRRQDLDRMSRPRRYGVFLVRLLLAVIEDLAGGQLTLRAMSLVYTTLLSMVPLLAVSFSVLKAFGVHNQIQPILAQFLAPLGPRGAEITTQIIEFVENMRVGVLGAVGLALLLYTVIALVQKVEQAFNAAWRIRQNRPFTQRFSHYLSVILIGPVLIFSALGITASFFGAEWVQRLSTVRPLGMLLDVAAALIPYALVIAAFTFIYSFVPNTRVRPAAAFAGALVAGVLWQSTGWVFASFVAGSTRYTAIYSAFAALILFMIWLYLSWLILLLGASVAVSCPESVPAAPAHRRHPPEPARAGTPWRRDPRAHRPGLLRPNHGTRRERAGRGAAAPHKRRQRNDGCRSTAACSFAWIRRGPLPVFRPAIPPDDAPVNEVLDRIRRHGEQPGLDAESVRLAPGVAELATRWENGLSAAAAGPSIRDLAAAGGDETPAPHEARTATD